MGKGNLFFHDYGKRAFTIGRRETGEAVRIATRNLDGVLGEDFQQVRGKFLSGQASASELRCLQIEAPQRILDADEDALFSIEKVPLESPAKARIFASVTCSGCGEQMMEPRARLRDGKLFCIPCSKCALPC
jgi:formylmethanofuran dehydrogenase subunit E